jgi:adenosylcobyric acid synthase
MSIARSLMVVGTTSHAGKSLLCAAICRILSRQGYRVAPFKGQNMALNAYVTESGKEMGHAQAVQAWAAKTTPRVEMNPILLKPMGDMTSQVIIQGEAVGKVNAADYYKDYFDRGWQAICESLDYLSGHFDFIVCEGAGSPAEINLKHRDLTNMRVAKHLNAPTLLVVDIDRGGAFAHVVGTLELLEPEERQLIKAVAINKFRGQRSLLDSGVTWLENYTQIPVAGVIPWVNRLFPAEDSLDLLERRSRKTQAELTIGVVRLPRISNFTDFDPLEAEPTVNLKYIKPDESLADLDALILPGSKTTIPDLLVCQKSGMDRRIADFIETGGTVLGICGGFQMLGKTISDLEGIEGGSGTFSGLGLLPLTTRICSQKVTRQRIVTATYPNVEIPVSGYEIHQGETVISGDRNYISLFDELDLGVVDSSSSVWGTYLHGIFDNGAWRRTWLNSIRAKRQLPPLPTEISNYPEQREDMLDAIADVITSHLDLTPLLA